MSSQSDEVAMEHVWAWFSLHAAQRMQSINLFLVSTAFVIGGYGAAFAAGNLFVAGVIAVVGLIIAISFSLLDIRNRELIRAAEVPLKILEERLAKRAALPSMALASTVSKPRTAIASYSWVVRFLVIAMVGFALVGGVVAFAGSGQSSREPTSRCSVHDGGDHPINPRNCPMK